MCMHMCLCRCMNVYMCARMNVCMCAFVHVSVYECVLDMYMYMYIFIIFSTNFHFCSAEEKSSGIFEHFYHLKRQWSARALYLGANLNKILVVDMTIVNGMCVGVFYTCVV